MKYNYIKNFKVPYLGFGCMRLPINQNNQINIMEFQKMVDLANCPQRLNIINTLNKIKNLRLK